MSSCCFSLFHVQTEGLPSVLPAPGFHRTLPAVSPPSTGGIQCLRFLQSSVASQLCAKAACLCPVY